MSSEFLQKARSLTGKLIRIEADSHVVASVNQFLQREANKQQMDVVMREQIERGYPTSEGVAEQARLYQASVILSAASPNRKRTVYIAGRKLGRP